MKRLVVGSLCALFVLAGCGGNTTKKDTANGSTGGSDVQLVQFEEPQSGDMIAHMETTQGTITLVLYSKLAPKAVENFATHAKDGYYDGVSFHRVIKDFMIQGGDPQGNGRGGESIWGKAFDNEYSNQLYHFRGALAMANAGPDTNGSQFYIVHSGVEAGVNDSTLNAGKKAMGREYPSNVISKYKEVGGTPSLDGGYTVFGQVIEGMDIVGAIATSETGSGDKPTTDIIINTITIEVK